MVDKRIIWLNPERTVMVETFVHPAIEPAAVISKLWVATREHTSHTWGPPVEVRMEEGS